jgi:hypothetical protein
VNRDSVSPPRRISWPLALTLIALIVAGVAAFIFWRLETWPARTARQGSAELERLGRDVRDALVEMAQLKPRVTIDNRIYLEKTTATAQLAILSRQVEVEHEFQHTWAGSTKRVKLHGTFSAKAGFDLQHDLAVDLHPEQVLITLPHATILGVEQQQVDVLAFENGFWNKISAADVEAQLAALPQLAREKAAESGILAEAETALQMQLNDRIHAERPVHLTFQNSVSKD